MKCDVAVRGGKFHDSMASPRRIAEEDRIAIMNIQTRIRLHDTYLEAQEIGLPLIVLIQKRDELAARNAQPGVPRARLASILLQDINNVAAIRLEDTFQIFGIRGAVVDYDDFVAGETLRQN